MRFIRNDQTPGSILSRAKINLTLEITGIREDGYHLLDSVMQKIALHDTLQIEIMKQARDHQVFCQTPNCPEHDKNIVYKALTAWSKATGSEKKYRVSIEKRIPMQAGLGGGSSNAAAVLRYLQEKAGVCKVPPLPNEQLLALATDIGADVPFCLSGITARCQGIGEIVKPLEPLPELPVLMLLGETPVNTKAAFKAIDERRDQGEQTPIDHLEIVQSIRRGDMYPGLAKANAFLFDRSDAADMEAWFKDIPSLYAGLSGSGPTYFLIFSDEKRRDEGAKNLKAHVPAERLVYTTLSSDI